LIVGTKGDIEKSSELIKTDIQKYQFIKDPPVYNGEWNVYQRFLSAKSEVEATY